LFGWLPTDNVHFKISARSIAHGVQHSQKLISSNVGENAIKTKEISKFSKSLIGRIRQKKKYCEFCLSGHTFKRTNGHLRIFPETPKSRTSKRTKRDFFKTFKKKIKLLFKVFNKVSD
jgi:hypothetical protein